MNIEVAKCMSDGRQHHRQNPVPLYWRLYSDWSDITVTSVEYMLQEHWASDTGRMAWVAPFTYRPSCNSAGGQHGPNTSYGPWCLHTAFSPSEPVHWWSTKLRHGVTKSESPYIFCGLHSEGMEKDRSNSILQLNSQTVINECCLWLG